MHMKGILIAGLIAVSVVSSHARETLPDLRVGMSASEVLTKAGAPVSKDNREIKREEVWYYNGYSVVLHEGYVARLEGLLAAAPTPAFGATQQRLHGSAKRTPPPDLLRNIIKELPATTPAPGSGPSAAQPPGMPPNMPHTSGPPNMMDIEQ